MVYCKGLLSVYPKVSRCKNVGNDGTGEHGGVENIFDCKLSEKNSTCCFEDMEVNSKIERSCAKYPGRNLARIIKSRIDRW